MQPFLKETFTQPPGSSILLSDDAPSLSLRSGRGRVTADQGVRCKARLCGRRLATHHPREATQVPLPEPHEPRALRGCGRQLCTPGPTLHRPARLRYRRLAVLHTRCLLHGRQHPEVEDSGAHQLLVLPEDARPGDRLRTRVLRPQVLH